MRFNQNKIVKAWYFTSNAHKEPKEVWMVKLADRISNLKKAPLILSKEKVNNYYEESKIILTELGSSNKELANRLEEKIKEYRGYL